MLPPIVVRIVAMFANEADGVYSHVASAESHGILNRGKDLEAMLCRKASAQVVGWNLIRVHGYQVGARFGKYAVGRITFQKAAENDRGMRVQPAVMRVHRDNGCHAFLGRLRRSAKRR